MTARSGVRLIVTAALWCGGARAQQHPDIFGYWELRFDSRNVPGAALLPAAAAHEAVERHDQDAIRWCSNLGVPFIMGDYAPLDIRQSPGVIGMVAMAPGKARKYSQSLTRTSSATIAPRVSAVSVSTVATLPIKSARGF
jgi:hypothetical protein